MYLSVRNTGNRYTEISYFGSGNGGTIIRFAARPSPQIVRNLLSPVDSDSKTGWVEFDVNSFVARLWLCARRYRNQFETDSDKDNYIVRLFMTSTFQRGLILVWRASESLKTCNGLTFISATIDTNIE